MSFSQAFLETEPTRDEIDAIEEPVVIEFGTPWCGFCRAAQPLIADALNSHPNLLHLKIEDGKGRRLGRSFGVKLWPTLIFMKDGEEVSRVVRPDKAEEISQKLDRIDSAG